MKGKLLQVVMLAFLLLSSTVAFAQAQVRGLVQDKAGEPLIGVNVLEKGTTNGVITDFNGQFTLNVAQGKTLVVSYVGYHTQEVTVKGHDLKIVLTEDTKLLDEVVVVGYGSMSRKDVTSSITTVKAEDLNIGAYTDPGQLLQGKVPGLVVVQNSDPNGGVNSITLRGASTLNNSTEPLYVVDGIPGVNMNLVAPADIESIDVLRDASATAIYGSKAANGVIIVTTKKGSDGPARVNYSGYVAWDNIVNDLDMMSADQLRSYAKSNGLTLPNDEGANTNWADETQRTGFAHNHNLSINGGNKQTSYNVSLNYIARDGAIKGVGNNLFNVRSYIETKTLKDHLTLGAGLNGNIRNEWGVLRNSQGASVYDAMYYYSPLVPVTNADGSWYKDLSISQNYNPLAMVNEDQSRATYKRIQATGKAQLKIIDGLLLNANFSYENHNYNYKDYYSQQSQTNYRNGYTSRNTKEDVIKLMEIYGNYDATFNDVHKLGLMAGYSWEEKSIGEGYGAAGYNFYNDDLKWNNIGLANSYDTDPVWANVSSVSRMISFYGRANYSYDGKYMLQAAVRRDGSSNFGANNRWATFPSASVAWRLSEEEFIKKLNLFNDLKLRVGWGQSGNAEGFDVYTSRFYYQGGTRFDYTDPTTGSVTSYKSLNAARNVNNDLKWETTTMLNVGVDFAFFNGRLNGTVEYYNKTTSDMIWDYSVSTSKYPVGTLTANVGKMTNKGIELSINAVPVRTRDFEWSTSLNFSHNANKVVSISNDEFNAGVLNRYNPNLPNYSTATIQRIIEGQPIGTFYMWEWAGYNEEGKSIFYVHDEETGERTGETTTTPQEKDRTIVGNAQPKLTMGWNNTFNYKNWDLNLFFTGVFGQKIFNELHAYYSNVANVYSGKNVLASVINDQKITDTESASAPSDRYLENGSYFKLSTLTLGYTFKDFNGWLQNLRLYASCNNVFTLTSYSGRDPEINLGGTTPGVDSRSDHFPRTRQFLFGVSINF
jgi:iron complex outermembrane receptor protein